MGILFGTDGVRGLANSELTCELSMNIGRAVATGLKESLNYRPLILIGKDTRISSDMLEGAIMAGICSACGGWHYTLHTKLRRPAFCRRQGDTTPARKIFSEFRQQNFNGRAPVLFRNRLECTVCIRLNFNELFHLLYLLCLKNLKS